MLIEIRMCSIKPRYLGLDMEPCIIFHGLGLPLRGDASFNQSYSWWRAVCQFKEANRRRGHRLWL